MAHRPKRMAASLFQFIKNMYIAECVCFNVADNRHASQTPHTCSPRQVPKRSTRLHPSFSSWLTASVILLPLFGLDALQFNASRMLMRILIKQSGVF